MAMLSKLHNFRGKIRLPGAGAFWKGEKGLSVLESLPAFLENAQLPHLRVWLEQNQYHACAAVPAFRTRFVYPLQDAWTERRMRKDSPLPLALHSDPLRWLPSLGPAGAELHRLLYQHRSRPLLPGWERWVETGLLGLRGDEVESKWQITALPHRRFVLSSIPRRSPGEFVYLGDDTGLLIEAAQELLGSGPPGPRALDLCCGCGVLSLALSHRFQAWQGLDANPDAITLARAQASLNECRNLEYAVSDLWEQASGQYDFIIGNPPALPLLSAEDPQLRFARGGSKPTALTLACLAGLEQYLRPGGTCLLLTFSSGSQLWDELQLSSEFSLSYRVRESFRLLDPQVPWLHHVWLRITRDGQGRRHRSGPTLWERIIRWEHPWAPLGQAPQAQRLAKESPPL